MAKNYKFLQIKGNVWQQSGRRLTKGIRRPAKIPPIPPTALTDLPAMVCRDPHDNGDDVTLHVMSRGGTVEVTSASLVSTWSRLPGVATHTTPSTEPAPKLL